VVEITAAGPGASGAVLTPLVRFHAEGWEDGRITGAFEWQTEAGEWCARARGDADLAEA
jgi:hypothetical protein